MSNYNFDLAPKSTSQLEDKNHVSILALNVDTFNERITVVLEKGISDKTLSLTFIEAKELGLINPDALKAVNLNF